MKWNIAHWNSDEVAYVEMSAIGSSEVEVGKEVLLFDEVVVRAGSRLGFQMVVKIIGMGED